MRTKYKYWAVQYIKENKKNIFEIDNFDIEKFNEFLKSKPTFLEIGPGKGQFITSIALKFPQYNYLVVELNSTIAGQCLKKIDELNLENVKLINGNFYSLIPYFENIKLEGIFLNFSDPWPKKRHEKRRLTSNPFINAYNNILEIGKCIYFKTDNDSFFNYSKEQFEKYKFETVNLNLEYLDDDIFDALTEYEIKFKDKGIKIKRIIVKKTDDTLKEII